MTCISHAYRISTYPLHAILMTYNASYEKYFTPSGQTSPAMFTKFKTRGSHLWNDLQEK